MQKYFFVLFLMLGFLSCKKSMQHQTKREYDVKLVRALRKLAYKYEDKKVRINTWDKKTDAYQDIQILDEREHLAETLTIGDSVRFVTLDLTQPDGIRAKVKLQNNHIGFISYFKIEEFEPATKFDPDLKE